MAGRILSVKNFRPTDHAVSTTSDDQMVRLLYSRRIRQIKKNHGGTTHIVRLIRFAPWAWVNVTGNNTDLFAFAQHLTSFDRRFWTPPNLTRVGLDRQSH